MTLGTPQPLEKNEDIGRSLRSHVPTMARALRPLLLSWSGCRPVGTRGVLELQRSASSVTVEVIVSILHQV